MRMCVCVRAPYNASHSVIMQCFCLRTHTESFSCVLVRAHLMKVICFDFVGVLAFSRIQPFYVN